MGIQIKHLTTEESIHIYHFLDSYAFAPTPPLPELESYAEKIRKMKGTETYAVFSDNEPMTMASSKDLTQNIRGKLFKMGGIASVSSHPAARRKGYAKRLIRHIFKEFHKDSTPVSCLYPFKESFYQRFGYIALPQAKKIIFSPHKLSAILDMNIEGTVELVKFGEGYPAFRKYLQTRQNITHGMSIFTHADPESAKERESWLVFAKYQGQVVGVMQYVLKGKMMEQHLQAYDFHYSTPRGKFLLLDWIARHVDQVSKVELRIHPAISGENLFTDLTPQHEGLFFPPMGRVIDLEQLAGLPVGEGEITLQITDTDCDWNIGVWKLTGSDGELKIDKGGNPECSLTIHALAALVYGVYDPEEFLLRKWGDPNVEQQILLRRMFPPAIPFLLAMY